MVKRKTRSIALFSIAAVALSTLALSGCAADSKPAADKSPGAGAVGQSLTIYTGRDKDEVTAVVAEFTKKYPQYAGKVKTIIAGAQDNLDRIRAEKSNPQGGFLWGGTQQQFEQASSEGLLTAYKSKNDALVPAANKDAANMWVAEMLLPEVIVYNKSLLPAAKAPKDWADLVKPEFKDKVIIRDVMPSGTMRTIYSAMIYKAFANGGSPQAGYDYLKALDANTVAYTATPDDMYTQLDQGTGLVTVWNLQDALIQPLKNKRPWAYVMPTSGAPVLLDAVGIINNKTQTQAAKDFEDFLMEPTEQAKLAKEYYQVPAMELPAADKPAWLASLKIIDMKVDWKVLGANQDKWMTYWVDNIKGKGKA